MQSSSNCRFCWYYLFWPPACSGLVHIWQHIFNDLRTVLPRPYHLKVSTSPSNTSLWFCFWKYSGSNYSNPQLPILAYFISTSTSYASVVCFSRLLCFMCPFPDSERLLGEFYQISPKNANHQSTVQARSAGPVHWWGSQNKWLCSVYVFSCSFLNSVWWSH